LRLCAALSRLLDRLLPALKLRPALLRWLWHRASLSRLRSALGLGPTLGLRPTLRLRSCDRLRVLRLHIALLDLRAALLLLLHGAGGFADLVRDGYRARQRCLRGPTVVLREELRTVGRRERAYLHLLMQRRGVRLTQRD
jgi:hypothetical protein